MKLFYLLILSFLISASALAQDSLMHFNVESQAIYTTNDQVPFWLRSNQFGSIPLAGGSASFIGRLRRDYNPNRKKLIDWGVGFEGRANIGRKVQGDIIEAYGKLRMGIFQLKAGRSKDISGLVGDSVLSSGSFSISGNALGVPKIELSIPEYYTLPILNNLFAIKGSFAHGWLGNVNIDGKYLIPKSNTYFHQSSLYGRFGKPDWKVKFYGGFNHQVFWGNYKKIFPDNEFTLSPISEFLYVVSGTQFNFSKVGNHLGSVDLGVDYTFSTIQLKLYRQNFYDVGALGHLANLRDGLTGITIINLRKAERSGVRWQRLNVELMSSKNQAGLISSINTKTGAEDYYNNYLYSDGWAYKGLVLGNPLFTTKEFARSTLAASEREYFVNNRVQALTIGFVGTAEDMLFTGKLTFSKNYGTYKTSGAPYQGVGVILKPSPDLKFGTQNQFSGYLKASKAFSKTVNGGVLLAIDRGTLLNNSAAIMVNLVKTID